MNDSQAMAGTQQIKQRVRQYIVDNLYIGSATIAFADGDSFMRKHIIDSTGFLELVSFLEDSFGFQVADEEMTPEHLDSLDNIAAYVTRKVAV